MIFNSGPLRGTGNRAVTKCSGPRYSSFPIIGGGHLNERISIRPKRSNLQAFLPPDGSVARRPEDGSLKSTLKAIFAIGRDYQSETGLLDDRRLIERSSEIPKVIESIILLRIVYLYLPLPPFAINSEGEPSPIPAGDFPRFLTYI